MISMRELHVLNSLLLGKILRSSTVIYRDKKAIFFLLCQFFLVTMLNINDTGLRLIPLEPNSEASF